MKNGATSQATEKHRICFLFPIFLIFVIVVTNMFMNIYAIEMVILINLA
ncbi:hypothetical protein F383_31204 [Gossypium arboreum]|uniref:Uncharacterized protein n=1 Tax=Gossypium arboreum TaxID=29729 RepID=A0A0B0PNW8_GOSAR|nr:hypothetical protein F383_31204 [Gossypium arboreum]